MKKKYFLSLIFLLALSSCSKNYYLVVSNNEVPIYTSDISSSEVVRIPSGKQFIIKGNKVKRYTSFGNHHGYTLFNSSWKSLAKLNKKQLKDLEFNSDKGYTYSPNIKSEYSSKKNNSNGGTISVKGYTRKDGTYVKPHTRSAPRRH